VPTIEAAERLQGFAAGWTAAIADAGLTDRYRWRLVGNAVPVPLSTWVAGRLTTPGPDVVGTRSLFDDSETLPWAAHGGPSGRWAVAVGAYPIEVEPTPLLDLVGDDRVALSEKATRGFHSRLMRSSLRRQEWFVDELESHLALMERRSAALARVS